jgi:hypothetical protein
MCRQGDGKEESDVADEVTFENAAAAAVRHRSNKHLRRLQTSIRTCVAGVLTV